MIFILSSGFVFAQTVTDTASCKSTSMVSEIENWYEDNMTYGSIAALMIVESSFLFHSKLLYIRLCISPVSLRGS